jgi:hypothetical protein
MLPGLLNSAGERDMLAPGGNTFPLNRSQTREYVTQNSNKRSCLCHPCLRPAIAQSLQPGILSGIENVVTTPQSGYDEKHW